MDSACNILIYVFLLFAYECVWYSPFKRSFHSFVDIYFFLLFSQFLPPLFSHHFSWNTLRSFSSSVSSKVNTSGGFSSVNPHRIGARFINRIANPNSVVVFQAAKKKPPRAGGKYLEPDNSDSGLAFESEHVLDIPSPLYFTLLQESLSLFFFLFFCIIVWYSRSILFFSLILDNLIFFLLNSSLSMILFTIDLLNEDNRYLSWMNGTWLYRWTTMLGKKMTKFFTSTFLLMFVAALVFILSVLFCFSFSCPRFHYSVKASSWYVIYSAVGIQ